MSGASPLRPRPGYDAIRLYAPSQEREHRIDLSDNTNLWGTAPEVVAALRQVDVAALTRYPSLYGGELKTLLAGLVGAASGSIVTGTGSDGVLEPAIRAFAQPGDRLAHPDPTFVMMPAFARMNGVEPVPVPMAADYDIDAGALLATRARIIYLCSPNNPTGRALSRESILRVVADAPGLVIIDEAYAEFSGDSALQLALASDRVLVTRTLSKAFGLAGLRVGYGIASPGVVSAIEKARGPYAVSSTAEAAAAAAVGPSGIAWMERHAREAVAVRDRFAAELRAMGMNPAPSDANFLFIPIGGAPVVARALSTRGIAVRAFSGIRAINADLRASGGDALRITVAPWPVLEQVLEALHEVLELRGAPGYAIQEER